MLPFQPYPAAPLPAVYWLLQTSLGSHVSSLLTVSKSPESSVHSLLHTGCFGVNSSVLASEKKGILSKTMFKVLPVQNVQPSIYMQVGKRIKKDFLRHYFVDKT